MSADRVYGPYLDPDSNKYCTKNKLCETEIFNQYLILRNFSLFRCDNSFVFMVLKESISFKMGTEIF